MAKLKIVEGKWRKKQHITVREVFLPLFQLWGDEHQFDYETFGDEAGLSGTLRRCFNHGAPKNIYLAAHGANDCVFGASEERVSRTRIRNALSGGDAKSIGLFVGACGFGNAAEFFLTPGTCVKWFAGYTRDIDWVDATIVDLYFWRQFLYGRKGVRGNLLAVARCMKEDLPMARRLGFNIYTRKKGPNGGVNQLIDWD